MKQRTNKHYIYTKSTCLWGEERKVVKRAGAGLSFLWMNRRKLIFFFLLIFFMGVGLFRTLKRVQDSRGRMEGLKTAVGNLEVENQQLQKEVVYRQSPEFIEQQARDQLKMVKDGEHLVILPNLPAQAGLPTVLGSEATSAAPPNSPVWKQWWNVFFGDAERP